MNTIRDFMSRISMNPDQTDIDAVTERFLSEMEKGLCGESSSLAMIPTYISVEGSAPDGVPVIAIDAGGTNLRVGIVVFEKGEPRIERLERFSMPGSHGEVTAEEFFTKLAEYVGPLAELSDIVGFCFSYPAEILENRDGRILTLTKEVQVKGAEGLLLGEALAEKLRLRGIDKPLRFVVLNDTVASLMGGIAHRGLRDADGMSGLILGTGCNTCYVEKGGRIKKLASARDMIVNLESGNFSGAGGGLADELLDKASVNPGTFRFEKMMSGAYMGQIVSCIARLASSEGLLSPAFADEGLEPFSAHETDRFMRGGENRINGMCKDGDVEALREVIDMCFERAAKLVCANIAALCLRSDGGKSPERPFCLVPEGSLFHGSLLFRKKFDMYVESHIEKKLGRHLAVYSAENSTMAGAALAALLNV